MTSTLGNVYRSFVVIALGGLLFGYVIGITSNVITEQQIICKANDVTARPGSMTSFGYGQCYELTPLTKGFMSSLNLIGACLSSLFAFSYGDTMGRKLEVQVAALLYFIGSLGTALSPVLWGIYVGLAVYGLGIGFAMHAAPVYIAEISPANVRGMLVSAKEGIIVLGMFLGFFTGYAFNGLHYGGWRYMVGIGSIFSLVMGAGIIAVPQSPRWLVLSAVRDRGIIQDRRNSLFEEAKQALTFFRKSASTEEVNSEMSTMRSEIEESVGTTPAKCTDPLNFPKPLIIGCGLVMLQQVTGQPSVLYFATNIFKSAGFGNTAALSSVGVGLVKLLATLFTVFRVDNYGRRFLLTVGISLMIVALALIGTAFIFRVCNEPNTALKDCSADHIGLPQGWAIATVIGLMIYVSGYQVGFGPISWLMISEIFPLRVRGPALSMAAIVNFGFNILMTLTQQILQDAFTPAGVFFGYLALSILSLIFVFTMVPETKGKTLEEIERMMSGKRQEARGGPIEASSFSA
mmetsp:Transcript_66432/g.138741  ORF Transcript_66432/g.138741 Transcript_66432/m.138741 type:complete len:518 (-) Transcript_66432:626-2179(-)